jgi:uroporphyrinogen III methyltransferase/synthase
MSRRRRDNSGKVYLVGAGPGDPGLITLRAAKCLRRADLVLYDYLVNPVILEHASPSAELVCLGHHQTGRVVPQEEVNTRMILAARQGKTVVRLKGGDPAVFAHNAEEMETLLTAGIEFEVVPGVTAALAAALYAEIPVTPGGPASAVALVTGQQRGDKGGRRLDYAELASFPGTLVFYMGVTSAGQWSKALLSRGRSPQTPVAVVRRCCWPDQRTVHCTLATVAEVVAAQRLRPPAVIFVGQGVDLRPGVSWFAARPLFGTRVLVTSSRDESKLLQSRLSELGADVWTEPAIRICDPPDWKPVDTALTRLDRYAWLVFSSALAVGYLLNRLLHSGSDLRRLGTVKLAAVGRSTAEQLAHYHLRADLVPRSDHGEALAEALADKTAGRRLLLVRAGDGGGTLAGRLGSRGVGVDEIVVCGSTDVKQPDPDVVAAVANGRIDWITVTSPAVARSLAGLFGEDLRRSRLASIGPITSRALRRLGYEPAVEATQHTTTGLAAAIVGKCLAGPLAARAPRR